jgi:hypothetical protein
MRMKKIIGKGKEDDAKDMENEIKVANDRCCKWEIEVLNM